MNPWVPGEEREGALLCRNSEKFKKGGKPGKKLHARAENALNFAFEFIDFDGFGDETVRTHLIGARLVFGHRLGRHGDDGNIF